MTRLVPLFLATAAVLAAALPATGQAVTPQQQKMTDCNAEAKTKALKGPERQVFMKTCLSGGAAKAPAAMATPGTATAAKAGATATPATAMAAKPAAATATASPTERMKACNTQAGTKSLKGDARKQFMATCLKA